jgi:hypothetical protein
MSEGTHVITSRLVMETEGPFGPVQIDAELRYDPSDPYAVAVAFHQGTSEVVWVFARDLLIRGLSEPVGEGDVRVFPSLDAEGHATVGLWLNAPTGQAVLKAAAQPVLGFVARTTQTVWPGTESDLVSADEAIAALLVD